MSLIEQAAKRLEQLRQAGVELPEDEVSYLHTAKADSAMQAPPPFNSPLSGRTGAIKRESSTKQYTKRI